jgi:hypothetical protein
MDGGVLRRAGLVADAIFVGVALMWLSPDRRIEPRIPTR